PLSGDDSRMAKGAAVAFTKSGSSLVSLASFSRISTAVTTFVFTPHIRCTFTHSCCCRTTPYLWSNQRIQRDVVKPDESIAKSASTTLSGKMLSMIRPRRMGVKSECSEALKIELKWGTLRMNSFVCASRTLLIKRRPENVEYTLMHAVKMPSERGILGRPFVGGGSGMPEHRSCKRLTNLSFSCI